MLRRRVRQARAARNPLTKAADADTLATTVLAIPEVASANVLTLYANLQSEPGTGPLREALAKRGTQVMLPIVLPERRLEWAFDEGELIAPAGLGGPEPTGPRLGETAPLRADVLLIPALAIDTLGHRLGQGEGYYDRVLSMVAAPVIALVHDDELLDAAVQPIPVEPHDRGVNAVATPQRWLRLR